MSKYDIRHKEILRIFLPYYFKLFFPELAPRMRFETAEFLDKELLAIQEYNLDSTSKDVQKVTDALILIEIELDEGKECILIHWEQESKKKKQCEERFFRYFCGIYFKLGRLVFPIVMFTDNAEWRKPIENCYKLSLLNFPIVDYRYQLIKLKNFSSSEFEAKIPENPLAAAYLPLTKYKKSERPLIKAKAIQGVAKTAHNSVKQAVLMSLIETSIHLDNDEEKEFKEIITKNINYKEAKMLQSVEELGIEIGMEKGIEEGMEKGREEGRKEGMEKEAKSLVVRLLNRKFKHLDDGIKTQIEELGRDEVENLGEDLIDMSGVEDLKNWLSR